MSEDFSMGLIAGALIMFVALLALSTFGLDPLRAVLDWTAADFGR